MRGGFLWYYMNENSFVCLLVTTSRATFVIYSVRFNFLGGNLLASN